MRKIGICYRNQSSRNARWEGLCPPCYAESGSESEVKNSSLSITERSLDRMLEAEPVTVRIAHHQLAHSVIANYRFLGSDSLRQQVLVGFIQIIAMEVQAEIAMNVLPRRIKCGGPFVS